MIALVLPKVLGKKSSEFDQPFAGNQKNTSDTSTNSPYHLILLLSNVISILCFSGYWDMMQIIRTEVQTPVSNTIKN